MFKHISIDLNHPFYDYVPKAHRDYIMDNKERFNNFAYCYHDIPVFMILTENYKDSLHVYELGGSFQFHTDKIITFMDSLTDQLGFEYYTARYKDKRLADIFKKKYQIEAINDNIYMRVL